MCTSKHPRDAVATVWGRQHLCPTPSLSVRLFKSLSPPTKPHQATAECWDLGTFVLNLRCPRIVKEGPLVESTWVLQCDKMPPRGQEGAIFPPAAVQRASDVFWISCALQSEILGLRGELGPHESPK